MLSSAAIAKTGKGTIAADKLESMVGQEVGVSDWTELDQKKIDAFADLTFDPYFIHTDPARAKKDTPFGGTIAHGLLTLSLVPIMAYEALPSPSDVRMSLNYGYNKVRFTAPVKSGKRVRAHFKAIALREVEPGRWDRITEVTVEIEGEPRPALVAEMISVIYL